MVPGALEFLAKACTFRVWPGARWLRTCQPPIPTCWITLETCWISIEESGSSKRPPDHAHRAGTHGRAVVPGAHGQSKIEQVAAVRMVARGCACVLALGRGSACGAGFQPLDMAPLLKSRGGTGTDLIKRSHAVDIFFSSAGQISALGRLVGQHRVQIRS